MSRKTLGYRACIGIFCATFLITFVLLKESRVPTFNVAYQGSIKNFLRKTSIDPSQEKQNHGNNERENSQQNPKVQIDEDKLPQVENCAPDSPRYVILLTYGRSGSSLTSDIISEHPDVFTYYEPLHNLAQSFSSRQKDYKEQNHKYLHLTDILEYHSAALSMIEKQMTCNYHRLSRFASLNLHAPSIKSTKELFHCVKSALTSKAEETCLMEAQERCEQKPLRFIKTIRLSVETMSAVLDLYPCSKLIYLVRDPRGSYHSKTRMFASHGQNVTWDAERFCSRLNKDVDAVIKLKEKYPDRIHLTRFETIAAHPIVSMKDIYEFIDLEFTQSIAKFVYQKTHSKTAGRGYSTDRTDSLDACYKWRKSISFENVKAFEHFCNEPFHKLGYLPANSLQDLRNLNKTLLSNADHFS
ncbi:hypothetical protein RRG08_036855 [Elysia crispata]|uniref:Sulfotransferase n=1 Tax=Elysia crispata TaxID=231223 RepID=A0AAE1AX03_9GAST|nr:hypothetical protein RRG08_036855 [Elysia crispata]